MHTCSNCGKSCIPMWRVLFNTAFSAPLFCTRCNARLIRKRRVIDLIVVAPLLLAMGAVQYWDIRSHSFVWFFLSFATVNGVVWWLHFVVFETIDDRTVSFMGRAKGRRVPRHD